MLFSAGFYYKTFMWPKSFWDKVYEPLIRGAAGLGAAPSRARPRHLRQPLRPLRRAGRRRRCRRSRRGARGGRAAAPGDPGRRAGGGRRLRSSPSPASTIDGQPAWDWLAGTLAALAALPNVTRADAHHRDRLLPPEPRRALPAPHRPPRRPAGGHAPRERLWKVRAKRVVLAQGAIEKPLVFAGNDRPGVMLAGAGAHLPQPLRRHASASAPSSSPRTTRPGPRPSTWRARRTPVAAIVDVRAEPWTTGSWPRPGASASRPCAAAP